MNSKRKSIEHRLMAVRHQAEQIQLLFFPFYRPKKRRLMLDQMTKLCNRMFNMNDKQVDDMTHSLAFELFFEHPDAITMIAKPINVELNRCEKLFDWKSDHARGLPSGAILRCCNKVRHTYSKTKTYEESNVRTIWHFATLREVQHEFRELILPLTEKCEHALRRHSGQIYKYANNSEHKWVVHKDQLYVSGLDNWQLGEIQQTPHGETCRILDEEGLFELWCWLSPLVELPT